MKKIININLSGRVIPIEDSAYESLQRYIESLRRYFATEDGRDEIINDIESRIAELMNDKIRKGASAVTDADIEEIISLMGRVEDFEAADAESNTVGSDASASNTSGTFSNFKTPRGRLFRDSNDKMLGGVCSGIGNYLNLDPALIRILLVLLIFGAGTGILVYILLWIILPARPLQRITGKRLFRNPDDRILGGVAGGLGTYFGKEPWFIRLIFAAPLILNILFGLLNGLFFAFHRDIFPNFVIGSFTGTFTIAYIILWIILPEAKSTYEKMEMRGENVDINRIRENVQSEIKAFGAEAKEKAKAWTQEAKDFANTRGKSFAQEASAAVKPIGQSAGNILGLIFKIVFMAFAGFIALMLFIALIAALSSGIITPFNDFMLNGTGQKFAFWSTVFLFVIVPLVGIITWIVRRIMRVRTHSRYLGWTFGGLWTLGWICLAFFIASMAQDWRMEEQVEQPIQLAQSNTNKLTVRIDEPKIRYSGNFDWINDNDDDGGWDLTNDTLKLSEVKLRVSKSPDSFYHVTVNRISHGRNRREATERAEAIEYQVSSLDSALILGSGFAVHKSQKFRGQRILVEVLVPVAKRISFDQSLSKIKTWNVRVRVKRRDDWRDEERTRTWHWDEYHAWEPGVEYIMTEEGKLVRADGKDQPGERRDEEVNSNETIDNYRYGSDSGNRINRDSLDRILQEKRKQQQQAEEEIRRLEELKRRREGE